MGKSLRLGSESGKCRRVSFPERPSGRTPPATSQQCSGRGEAVGAVTFATTVRAPPIDSASTPVHDLPPPPTLGAQPPPQDPYRYDPERVAPASRPFLLRTRVRATVFLVVVGVPLLLAYVAAHFFTDALWFKELGQLSVLGHAVAAKAELYIVAGGTAAVVIGANLDDCCFASQRRLDARGDRCRCCRLGGRRELLWVRRCGPLADVHALAASADVRRHGSASRQGRRILRIHAPFERAVVQYSFLLVAAAAVAAALVYWARGSITLRPLRVAHEAQVHAAVLGAAFLLILAWRLRLRAVHPRARPTVAWGRQLVRRGQLRRRPIPVAGLRSPVDLRRPVGFRMRGGPECCSKLVWAPPEVLRRCPCRHARHRGHLRERLASGSRAAVRGRSESALE